jgi:hypothetical protein
VQLALQGQTVALDMLHGNREEIAGDIWYFLKDNRHRFYTRNMRAFIGYARKQAAKYGVKGSRLDAVREALAFLMTQGDTPIGELWRQDLLWESEHTHISLHVLESYWVDENNDMPKPVVNQQTSYWEVCGKKMTFGGKASYYVPMLKKFYEQYGHRAQLAAKNEGVDWKAVSHALRVGYQTKAIFTSKTFSYPLKETPYLLSVKQGRLPYNEVAGVLDSLIEELEVLSNKSSLPDQPDVKFWETWLAKVTLEHIKRSDERLPVKVYVVMEIGWEYNDETYCRSDDGGGIPRVAYRSKEDALIACAEMNARMLEQPHCQHMITEWRGDDDIDYVQEFYEVKEVILVDE